MLGLLEDLRAKGIATKERAFTTGRTVSGISVRPRTMVISWAIASNPAIDAVEYLQHFRDRRIKTSKSHLILVFMTII